MSDRPWIQTFSGVPFEPLNPDPDLIDLEDVAHALSNVCRYTGHVHRFYSVAEHSVRVAWLLGIKYGLDSYEARAGLLHDASEAYLTDLAAPVKQHPSMKAFRDAEERLEAAVAQRFEVFLTDKIRKAVKLADLELLNAERLTLLGPEPESWGDLPPCEHVPTHGMGWSPEVAKRVFLNTAERLVIL